MCGSVRSRRLCAILLCAATALMRSTDVDAGDGAADHEPLDLRRALEDRVDLGVAVHALDGELARVAVAAEDLDRALRRPHGPLARLELAHRALGGFELAAGPAHPRGAPDEQAGG